MSTQNTRFEFRAGDAGIEVWWTQTGEDGTFVGELVPKSKTTYCVNGCIVRGEDEAAVVLLDAHLARAMSKLGTSRMGRGGDVSASRPDAQQVEGARGRREAEEDAMPSTWVECREGDVAPGVTREPRRAVSAGTVVGQ